MQTVNLMLIIFGGFLIVVSLILLIYLFFFRKYKHFVEVREILSGGKKRIKVYKACDHYSDSKKVKRWKLRGMKDPLKKFIPVPPNEVIDINHKGKNFVVVYMTETGEMIFRKDDIIISELPKDFYKNVPEEITNIEDFDTREKKLNEWKSEKYEVWLNEVGATIAFMPYSTSQRIMHVANARRAEEQRAKSSLEKYLPLIGVAVVIVFQIISFILIAVFWADLTEPVITVQKIKLSQIEQQTQLANILEGIETDVQSIKSTTEATNKKQTDLAQQIKDNALISIT